MVVWGGLTHSWVRREVKGKGEKERYTHLNQNGRTQQMIMAIIVVLSSLVLINNTFLEGRVTDLPC